MLALKYTIGWKLSNNLIEDTVCKLASLFPLHYPLFLLPKVSLCNGKYPLPRYPKWYNISVGQYDLKKKKKIN